MFRYYCENQSVLETMNEEVYEIYRTDYNNKGEKIRGDLIVSSTDHPRDYSSQLNDSWLELYINYRDSSTSFNDQNNIPCFAMKVFKLHKLYDSL